MQHEVRMLARNRQAPRYAKRLSPQLDLTPKPGNGATGRPPLGSWPPIAIERPLGQRRQSRRPMLADHVSQLTTIENDQWLEPVNEVANLQRIGTRWSAGAQRISDQTHNTFGCAAWRQVEPQRCRLLLRTD